MGAMGTFRFEPLALPAEAEEMRTRIRAFLAETLDDVPVEEKAKSWGGHDAAFSAKLGEAGFIGLTWPKAYGGHERSALERYVVLEECLAAGAPVGAHWVADRQSGPLLLKLGTEEHKQKILPEIIRGRCFFAIGMSEPDSGSDLASVRSKAVKDGDEWVLNGTKLWTSNAHRSHYMIALFRTDSSPDAKHSGLSQFLIDMSTPGITPRPIADVTGYKSFNEVQFEDVRLPADALLGGEGQGWSQVTSELALERSGPERFLSSYRLLVEMIRELEKAPSERAEIAVGRLTAHLMTLRQMSLSIAGMLANGEDPALEASVVKDLGAVFEQEIPEIAQQLVEIQPSPSLDASAYERILAKIVMTSPSFSLRGGTREILRGIIARGLGLR